MVGRPAAVRLLSSPPSTSHSHLPGILELYQVLSDDNRRVFQRIYVGLWRYLFGVRSFLVRSSACSLFWAADLIRQKYDLTSSELSVLTFFYYYSGCGRDMLHSQQVYDSVLLPGVKVSAKISIVCKLVKQGYLLRSRRNKDNYYCPDKRPVFIGMTTKGKNFVTEFEHEVYKMLLHSSLNDLSGANKRP